MGGAVSEDEGILLSKSQEAPETFSEFDRRSSFGVAPGYHRPDEYSGLKKLMMKKSLNSGSNLNENENLDLSYTLDNSSLSLSTSKLRSSSEPPPDRDAYCIAAFGTGSGKTGQFKLPHLNKASSVVVAPKSISALRQRLKELHCGPIEMEEENQNQVTKTASKGKSGEFQEDDPQNQLALHVPLTVIESDEESQGGHNFNIKTNEDNNPISNNPHLKFKKDAFGRPLLDPYTLANQSKLLYGGEDLDNNDLDETETDANNLDSNNKKKKQASSSSGLLR